MNIIAIDIGNTNVTIGLFLGGKEVFIKSAPGGSLKELTDLLVSAWDKIPPLKSSKEKKKDGVIVASSVNPLWAEQLKTIIKDNLGEKMLLVGVDIPLPMEMDVDEPEQVGTDRVVSAAAAYAVVEDAVIVASVGTAVTVDIVDTEGVFLGGAIFPGLELAALTLKENTAKLPKVEIKKPRSPFGKNTVDAINCGLYYSAIAALQEIIRRYAEKIGKWPQTILTGGAATLIKDDCEFIDSFVPNLVVKGIVLTYQKYLDEKAR